MLSYLCNEIYRIWSWTYGRLNVLNAMCIIQSPISCLHSRPPPSTIEMTVKHCGGAGVLSVWPRVSVILVFCVCVGGMSRCEWGNSTPRIAGYDTRDHPAGIQYLPQWHIYIYTFHLAIFLSPPASYFTPSPPLRSCKLVVEWCFVTGVIGWQLKMSHIDHCYMVDIKNHEWSRYALALNSSNYVISSRRRGERGRIFARRASVV